MDVLQGNISPPDFFNHQWLESKHSICVMFQAIANNTSGYCLHDTILLVVTYEGMKCCLFFSPMIRLYWILQNCCIIFCEVPWKWYDIWYWLLGNSSGGGGDGLKALTTDYDMTRLKVRLQLFQCLNSNYSMPGFSNAWLQTLYWDSAM